MSVSDEERRRHDFLNEVGQSLFEQGSYRIMGADEIGERILEQLRNEKGLTDVAAYAGLQYASETL
jgi:hypothetical protein